MPHVAVILKTIHSFFLLRLIIHVSGMWCQPLAGIGRRRFFNIMGTTSDKKRRTVWHPLAVQAIRGFVPEEYEVLEEFSLSVLPERVDIVIVECNEVQQQKAEALGAIMDRLNKHNLIEVKGATDRLEGRDFLILMGYATRYMVNRQLSEPSQVSLFTLSDGIPATFREQVRKFGFTMREVVPGVEEVEDLPGELRLYSIDAGRVSKTPGNALFYLFTGQFLERPREMIPSLSPSEAWMYSQLASHVVQLEERKGKDKFTYRGFDMIKRSMEEAAEAILDILPVERRLRGLRAEGRLRGLRAEEILEQLKKTDRLEETAGALLGILPAEQRLKGLGPEERLRGLRPEERLRGLRPEERERLKKLLM